MTCSPELETQQLRVFVAAQALIVQSGSFDVIAFPVKGVEVRSDAADLAPENPATDKVFHDSCSYDCYTAFLL
jgi:hypothetical protein